MRFKVRDYLPLVYIYLLTATLAVSMSVYFNSSFKNFILYFLGFFAIILSLLKLVRLQDFVEAFYEYDFVSQKFRIYAYLFPIFELIFGVSFLLLIENPYLEILCLSLFILNFYSVILALKKKRKFVCACLGDLIKVPLSYVSLIENLTMIFGVLYLITN